MRFATRLKNWAVFPTMLLAITEFETDWGVFAPKEFDEKLFATKDIESTIRLFATFKPKAILKGWVLAILCSNPH